MDVGDVLSYRIPQLVDPEGNDMPECYIDKMEGQEDKYPPFLMYENSTQTITLMPNSTQVQGRTYYFSIIVKEKHSHSIVYPYFCTIKIGGEIFEQDMTIKYTEFNYTINWISGYQGSLKWNNPINMTWMKDNFDNVFQYYWTDTDYIMNKIQQKFKNFEVTEYGWQGDDMTLNFTMTFFQPYYIGLLNKKSDNLKFQLKNPYDGNEEFYCGMFYGNCTELRLSLKANETQSKRMEIIFDTRDPVMQAFRSIASKMYYVVIALILVQFIMLASRGVGLLPVWILVEYLQLVAFMPIYNFRLIPYLYDAFKPALVSHLIVFDETPGLAGLDREFFNKNYKFYNLSVGRLAQAAVGVGIVFAVCIVANIVVFVMSKVFKPTEKIGQWAQKALVQFKMNVYIRAYMLCYFDATFFSLMKIMEDNNSTSTRKVLLLVSYVIFIISIILPTFLITMIFKRFEILKIKEAKQTFNTLLLKIDKSSKWRIVNPAYFFARRLLTAILLTLPIDNTFIFLQYVFILMSSHAYILYMVAFKPYQTAGINSYVLANETFYSALIIAIFIFSDATPERNIKFGAGVALIASLILLLLSNLLTNIVYMIRGPEKLKQDINESKLKRAEKEALERAEEEERKLKKKKEEEEFTKLHDETQNLSRMDETQGGTTLVGNTTQGEFLTKGKKRTNKGGKGKDTDANVVDGGMAGVDSTDFGPKSKHRKPKGDKDKGAKGDDVVEAQMEDYQEEKKPRRKKKKKVAEATDPTTGTGGGQHGATENQPGEPAEADKDYF